MWSTSANLRRARRSAFTLIELLTVVGILALLIGILLPVILTGIRTAERARGSADLQAIATALEAYHSEFGDYPRSSNLDTAPIIAGSQVLLEALISPRDDDGKAGPGFRKRPGGQGQVYGPYLPLDKFKSSNTQLFDRFGQPILYYPARPVKPNIGIVGGFIAPNSNSLYDSRYGSGLLTEAQLSIMMGDLSVNGAIDNLIPQVSETPAYTGPFLLISAGSDTKFGTGHQTINPSSASDPTPWIFTNFGSLPPFAGGPEGAARANSFSATKSDDVTNFK